jgi:hypothetical protein
MIYRLTRLAPHQTAKVIAFVYGVIAVVVAPILYLVSRAANPADALPASVIILGPILYGILGYVFTAVGCLVYNLVASRAGGIEFVLDERAPAGLTSTQG